MISFPGKLSQTCHLFLSSVPSSPRLPKTQFNHQSLTDHAQHTQLSKMTGHQKCHSHSNSPPTHLQQPLAAQGMPCASSHPFPIVTAATTAVQLPVWPSSPRSPTFPHYISCLVILYKPSIPGTPSTTTIAPNSSTHTSANISVQNSSNACHHPN